MYSFRIIAACGVWFAIFYYNIVYIHTFKAAPFRLVDVTTKELFFDRAVYFTLDVFNFTGDGREYKTVATGVLISSDRVLTSYNAFRNLTKTGELLNLIYLCYVTTRMVKAPYRTFYEYECSNISCARPLVPMEDEELIEEQWHGPDKKHSPVHDLLVARLDAPVELWQPEVELPYHERYTPEIIAQEPKLKAGPLLTELIGRDEKLNEPIRYVSVGLTNKKHYILEMSGYNEIENMVNCEEWLLRSWGHFFCLTNDDVRFNGFASGALLFADRKLIGIGSFSLWRGKDSILVFTDIRPYLQHINNTCAANDLF